MNDLPGEDRWTGEPEWELVPAHLREGLRRYVEAYVPTGDFLKAVLSNNLTQAVAMADENSFRGLPDLLRFLWHHAPASSWGSAQNVAKWLQDGRR